MILRSVLTMSFCGCSINNISENHEINTEETDMNFKDLVERLREMFPKQDYQSRLDNFVNSKRPQTVAEVEHWQKHFDRIEMRRLGL